MSLYGVMRTSVSGMAAQANRLATVAENVANVGTTGYKKASCEFSSLILSSCPDSYESGSVATTVRHAIENEGGLTTTGLETDLAIGGGGFFIVADSKGTPFLTRAGAFSSTDTDGLVNSAGFTLLGYRLENGAPPVTINGYAGLEPVDLKNLGLKANASTSAIAKANLPADAVALSTPSLPSANSANADFTAKSSIVSFDSLGREVLLDMYFSKTPANNWELTVFDRTSATSATGFPYGSGPLLTTSLAFDPSSGALSSAGAGALSLTVPGGETLSLDLSGTTQLATDYSITAEVNGNPPSATDEVQIERDGTIYVTYENGSRVPVFRIPLATVTSPDQLEPLAGNVFLTTQDSGDVQVGFPQSGKLGEIISGALEQSNADLATELTNMIDSQRSYSANSKVFQTGAELMDVLVNLKR